MFILSAYPSFLSLSLLLVPSLPSLGSKGSLIDALFEIEFEETTSNSEDASEAPKISYSRQKNLKCNIDGGAGSSEKITDISAGIQVGLSGSIEKFSESLGRNCIYKTTNAISKLPRYICLQMMRFYWKRTPDSMDHAGVPCKILKAVSFPMDLDVYELCNKQLKDHMKVFRDEEASKKLGGLSKSKLDHCQVSTVHPLTFFCL